MAGSEKRTFTCPQCRKQFAWKDSYVNKKVSCKCGEVFTAFEDVPEAVAIDAYDVAEDEVGHKAVTPASTVAASVVAAQTTSPLAAYPVKVRQAVQDDQGVDDSSPLRNLVLPTVLLLVGVLLAFVQASLDPRPEKSAGFTVALNLVFLGIMTVTMLGGGAISAALLSVDFGALNKCVLKFAATAVFTGSVAVTAANLDPEPLGIRGKVVAMHIVVVLYWICFQMMFDLDVQESLMSVTIIAALQGAVACVLWNVT